MAEHPVPTPEQSTPEHTPAAITAGPETPEREVAEAQARLHQRYEVPQPEARPSSHPESEPGDISSVSDPEEFFTPVIGPDGQVDEALVASSLGYLDDQVKRTASHDELVGRLQDMELQGLVTFEDGKPRTIDNATFPHDNITYESPDGRVVSSSELYQRGYARLRTLDRITVGDQTPATFAVRTELHNQRVEAQREEHKIAREQAEVQQAADEAKADRMAEAQAKLDAAAQGSSGTKPLAIESSETTAQPEGEHQVSPDINLAPTEDMAEAKTGEGPFKVDRQGETTTTTAADMQTARTEHAKQSGEASLLSPLPRAKAVDTSRRPDVRSDGKSEAHYVTDVDQAMEMAFQNDREASVMNALAAEYRMQHELLMQETNTSLTHDRKLNGGEQSGEMKLLEDSYKAAIKEVRERFQKHKATAVDVKSKLAVARANHEDFDISILSGKKDDGPGKAWTVRRSLGIVDGAKPIHQYGGERGYGGIFHGGRDRGARMVQRVYKIPTGGYLVECVNASTGQFVRQTVINSAREPMRFGYFRLPFTGTAIEAKLKTLRQADLRREPPRNIGDYFGLRFGPEMPGRSGRFSYDMAGTAAWDSQLGNPRYNQRRRVPWYLQLFTIGQRN